MSESLATAAKKYLARQQERSRLALVGSHDVDYLVVAPVPGYVLDAFGAGALWSDPLVRLVKADAGRAEEREKVLGLLKELRTDVDNSGDDITTVFLDEAIKAIEAGEHWAEPDPTPVPCSECNGKGRIPGSLPTKPVVMGGVEVEMPCTFYLPCTACHSSGAEPDGDKAAPL